MWCKLSHLSCGLHVLFYYVNIGENFISHWQHYGPHVPIFHKMDDIRPIAMNVKINMLEFSLNVFNVKQMMDLYDEIHQASP
jgi:hypothetical protein